MGVVLGGCWVGVWLGSAWEGLGVAGGEGLGGDMI